MDPAGEFYSPYESMGNNSVNLVDPDGACIICLGSLFDFATNAIESAKSAGEIGSDQNGGGGFRNIGKFH